MERWSGVVATGASGATIIEFVHTEDVISGTIEWTYLEVIYALMYPDGSYAPECGDFLQMYYQLKIFDENFDPANPATDGVLETEFLNKDWPRSVSDPVAPDEPRAVSYAARSRKPKL